MKSIFGPVPINPVNIGPTNINEKWLRFKVICNVKCTENSPFVPCILLSVNVKLTGVLKLFCDNPNFTWEHLNRIPSRPLTSINKDPEYALTRNITNSV